MKFSDIVIAAALDRAFYPLNSILHITISLNKILKNHLIEIKILDSTKNLMFSKNINPKKVKYFRSLGKYIIKISVPMKGSAWKVGESYTVLAKHGYSESLDMMTITKRKPLIQTDKSVYMLDSDIILTVIDPDLDRDSERVEKIGDKSYSKLIIETSKGKISNYQLKETGTSTGIFQGIIGLTSGKYIANNIRKIWKTSGKGPLNGYIPASIGDSIYFTYKKGKEIEKLIAFTSNFGAIIELDKKIYKSTDRVYITVVAPDYNFKSKYVDTIGNKFDCNLIISTNKGKLQNYKLIETGNDTGIFTGEIQLINPYATKKVTRSHLKTKFFQKKGPKNGILPSTMNDNLVVKFVTESGTFRASAKIKKWESNWFLN